MKKLFGLPFAVVAGLVGGFALAAPAFAQTVDATVSASASVGGLDGLIGTLTGLLGGLGL